MTLFLEFSLIIVLAAAVSLATKVLKQPMIVGYIIAGIIVGPYALNILQAKDEIELFSKIGIAVLLFIVGLTLNPEVMREVGKTSLLTGIGQVVFTALVGFIISRALGFGLVSSGYISVALTFSSTIIVLKLLTDTGDIEKLYGKISIGLLLVQDVIAVALLLVVNVLGNSADNFPQISNNAIFEILNLLTRGLIVSLVLYLISRYLLPKIVNFVAGYQEALFIFSLAWGLGISSLFYLIGFSIEIGALIAGITLAASPFTFEMTSRIKPLRDFFIMLFFILLGSQISIDHFSSLIIPAIMLSIFVLVGNPFIMYIIMNLIGYRNRTAFLAGLTVAQISEFSLILVALGHSLGHINAEIVSLVTIVGIITIFGSTYFILYGDLIYTKLRPILRYITIRNNRNEEQVSGAATDMIIFGYDRVGFDFVKVAKDIGAKFLVIDFNPQSIVRLRKNNIPYKYGDAEDVEFLEEINLSHCRLVVSTIPDLNTNLLLVKFFKSRNPEGIIIVISHSAEKTRELYEAGASYVVMPHHLGAKHAASLINSYRFDSAAFHKEKMDHLESLERRMVELS